MTLYHQVLNPENSAPALTFIHGWAANSGTWMDFAERFCDPFQVHLIDLPGFGESPPLEMETKDGNLIAERWMEEILQVLPETTHLVGWSLGGLLAQRLTAEHPRRVLSLMNVASTPKFVQTEDWPYAVSPSLLKDFIHAVAIEYVPVLKQFWRLQFQGSDEARKWMKALQSQMQQRKMPSLTGLLQGLYILKALDNRPLLPQIRQPTLWLFGEKDPLVPLALTESVVQQQPNAQIAVIDGAGHMPFFSHPEACEQAMRSFLLTSIEST
jgi:pimeloyl-[acyl-carrier protein] methyl ester esterase